MVMNRIKPFCDPDESTSEETPWFTEQLTASVSQPVQADWQAKVKSAFEQLAAKAGGDRLARVEKELLELKENCNVLRDRQSIVVPVNSLDPEPYELLKGFMAVVQPEDESFVATFFDANINASGETQADAIENLKDVLITTFQSLENETRLGRGAARRLAILRTIMRKKG